MHIIQSTVWAAEWLGLPVSLTVVEVYGLACLCCNLLRKIAPEADAAQRIMQEDDGQTIAFLHAHMYTNAFYQDILLLQRSKLIHLICQNS
ncbi:hypothetical protein D3C72_1724040 [compost metagenome]